MVIWKKFKELWIYYLLQSALAAVAVLACAYIYGKDHIVVIASMGATAFICFAMPNCPSAKRRNVIFGHFMGLLSGAVFTLVNLDYHIEFPLAVGLVMFLMVALDVEHPPAAGTALAVVTRHVSWTMGFEIIFAAIIMAELRYLLKNHIKDLV